MPKSWRHNLVTTELPAPDQLLSQFSSLLDSIVDITLGRAINPTLLHFWFYKRVSYLTLSQTKTWTPHTYTLIRERIDSLPNLDEEDIRQQAQLYLLEMHSFYNQRKPGKKTKMLFYDYVRFNLIKYMASWISHQILLTTGDALVPQFSDVDYLDEPDDLDFSLGWVMLKSNHGVLSELTIRQKYLVYLRYIKSMTIIEIASMTDRHRSLVEKDFSIINNTLGIGGHYVNSRNSI